MIISGGSRSNWRFFAKHLVKTEENERVTIPEIRGLAAEDVTEAFREMDALASGTRCKNFFYHANINPRADEHLTEEQWEQAVDTLEAKLGLEGHSRFIVEHEKEGRVHRHVVWSRIDTDSMTAVSDSNNYAKHEQAARAIEQEFGLEPVESVHGRTHEHDRPDRRPKNWETFRGHQSGIDPDTVKQELTGLWQQSDSGAAFAAALEDRGYILAKGDKRDFVVIDQAGDAHSLARRIAGTKAADIRERMEGIDRDSLPSVAEASEIAYQRQAITQAPERQTKAKEETSPLEVAESIGKAALDAVSETEREAEPHGPLNLLERTAVNVAVDAVKDHWQEWAAKVGEFLRDESDSVGLSAHVAPARPASEIDYFAAQTHQAMREGGGDPQMNDGMRWWERSVTVLTAARDQVTDWIKGTWQDWVDRFRSPDDRAPGTNHDGMER